MPFIPPEYYGAFRLPTNPPLKPEDAARRVKDALDDAVWADDTDRARDVLQQAFWHKIAVKPDSFQLYRAIAAGSRGMAELLLKSGATWSQAESAAAFAAFNGTRQSYRFLLKRHGIETDFTQEALAAIDPVIAASWNRDWIEGCKKRGIDHEAVERKLNTDLAAAFQDAVKSGDISRAARALDLMPNPHIQGAFTKFAQDDAAVAFSFIDCYPKKTPAEIGATFDFAKLLKDLGIEQTAAILPEMDKRGMTGDGKELRAAYLSLLFLRLDMTADTAAAKKALADDVDALYALAPAFLYAGTAGKAHAAVFMDFRRGLLKSNKDRVAGLDLAMLDNGFYSSAAFDGKALLEMADSLPAGEVESRHELLELSRRQNGVTLYSQFETVDEDSPVQARLRELARIKSLTAGGIREFLNPDKIQDLARLVYQKKCALAAADVPPLFDYLNRIHDSKDARQATNAEVVLTVLKKNPPDLSLVNASRYIGSREPGFAATLLREEIVPARQFESDSLMQAVKPYLEIPPSNDRARAMTSFFAQVVLETAQPEKFTVASRSRGVDYIAHFRQYLEQRLRDGFKGPPYNNPQAKRSVKEKQASYDDDYDGLGEI